MKTRIAVLAIVALASLFQAATTPGQTSRADTGLGAVITTTVPQTDRNRCSVSSEWVCDSTGNRQSARWKNLRLVQRKF
jgi:hypothetical protein